EFDKDFVYIAKEGAQYLADCGVRTVGVDYISSQEVSADDLAARVGNIDLVYEGVGEPHVSFEVVRVLGINGVFIFTGIPAQQPAIPIFAANLMRNIVLKNHAIVGTVNASPQAFIDAIRDLGEFKRRWPEAIRALITGRHAVEAYRDLLVGKAKGIKNVIEFT
ncbi:MAG TPA: hypothetical protein VEO95_04945, partial [Chthoniobacteraceae bacterium]|nr:hypothetical protein [Chthoniobacteraceae bacterium]